MSGGTGSVRHALGGISTLGAQVVALPATTSVNLAGVALTIDDASAFGESVGVDLLSMSAAESVKELLPKNLDILEPVIDVAYDVIGAMVLEGSGSDSNSFKP